MSVKAPASPRFNRIQWLYFCRDEPSVGKSVAMALVIWHSWIVNDNELACAVGIQRYP